MKKMFFGLCALLFFVGLITSFTGSPAVGIVIGTIALISGLAPKPKGALLNNIDPDVSALTGWAAKHQKKIWTKFENSLDFFKDLTTFFNIKSETKLTKLAVNGQPRPFTGIFSPVAGDIVYSDQTINTHKWQRDFQIRPDNYRNTYLQELRGAGENANNMKFPPHVFDTVVATLAGNINDIVPWHGVGEAAFSTFNPVTEYTVGSRVSYTSGEKTNFYTVVEATDAGDTPISAPAKFKLSNTEAIAEGLGVKLRRGRTQGSIKNVVSTGEITKEDAYEQLKAVWRAAPEWLRTKGGVMEISHNVMELLEDSFEDISKYTEKDGSLIYLPKTNKKCLLKPRTWITNSDMVTVTDKDNFIAATDLESDYRVIRTIPQMYHLDFGMTGVLGFGIQDLDAISMNDRD